MKIEEGKYYRNRRGEKVGPIQCVNPISYWDGENCYDERGRHYKYFRFISEFPWERDLIEEWTEPKGKEG